MGAIDGPDMQREDEAVNDVTLILTYIWMQMNMPEYAEIYLKKFCDATNTSSRYVHNWIPIVASAD